MSQEQQTLLQQKITFHGAGAMAEAIVRGLISRLVVRPQDITMLNRSNQKRQEDSAPVMLYIPELPRNPWITLPPLRSLYSV